MTAPIYAIGDIHGQREMLEHALDKIERDGGKDARVVFLGDYVDRGPDCKGVLDILIDGKAQGKDWITLMGNHDRMFAMFMRDYPVTDSRLLVGYDWFHDRIGGVETLASYGVEVTERSRIFQIHSAARETIPPSHTEFLNTLPTTHEEQGLLFVHAGIRPGIALQDQSEEDLVWIREEFLDDPRAHPWLVVHGHTPVKRATHAGNHVNLDTGAGYGKPLSTAVFDGTDCWVLTDQGRDPLTP